MHPPRIALYSHDTQGLGHIRRNLAIATTLANTRLKPAILLVTGAREAASFSLPPGVDCLALPGLSKSKNGDYHSRGLNVPFHDLIELRSESIYAGLRSFKPNLLIVDKVPLGAFGELRKSLEYLRRRQRTAMVLGLRDILDEPVVARREWSKMSCDCAIREFYDAVWVYGDPAIFDPAYEYHFSQHVTSRIDYTGYLCRSDSVLPETSDSASVQEEAADVPEHFVLCLLGGGQDGYRLGQTFADTAPPDGMSSIIVAGPFMPPQERKRLHQEATRHSYLFVRDFVTKPEPLIKKSALIVAMGGYNTFCDILALQKRALIVPRIRPRREQFIRAELFSGLGVVEMLHPQNLGPRQLREWLTTPAKARTVKLTPSSLDGLRRVTTLTGRILNRPV